MRSAQLVLVALFVAAQTWIVTSGFILFAMIGKVNRRLPDDRQISYLGAHPLMYRRIFGEYRRLYPQGKMVLYFYSSVFLGVAFLVVFAWEGGFF